MRRTRCRARHRRGGKSGSKYRRAPSPGGQLGGAGAFTALHGAGGGVVGCHVSVTPMEQPTPATLNLLVLLSWAAFPHRLCFPGRVFKDREQLETEGMRYFGVFFPTLPNLFWVLSSPCALETDGMCGPASGSWDLVQHPSCSALGLGTSHRSCRAWAGLGQLDHGIFLMG